MLKGNYTPYGPVQLGQNVIIYPGCRLGLPKEARLPELRAQLNAVDSEMRSYSVCSPTVIGDDCVIGVDAVIYEGTSLSRAVTLEDRVRIGYDCSISSAVRLMYGAYVCDRVNIGKESRIAGFICDAVVIGERSTVMGNLVHSYTVPDLSWGMEEAAPIIGSDCVIGHSAVVVGGVKVGSHSYIAAGAIVTKDVPANTIVIGRNEHHDVSNWSGRGLRELYIRKGRQK